MRKNLLIIFGGQSSEHEVSVMSARNILANVDRELYNPFLLGISRTGCWYFLHHLRDNLVKIDDIVSPDHIIATIIRTPTGTYLTTLDQEHFIKVDVVFPVLHGKCGEDGAMQGLLQIYNLPFVGAGVLGSAIGMDKDVSKRLLQHAGILVPKFKVLQNIHTINYEELARDLGNIMFVKPANTGSSIGVRKIRSHKELLPALEDAFKHDNKVIVEEFIQATEIECAILVNKTAELGEIRSQGDCYSYEDKYFNEMNSTIFVPALIDEEIKVKIKDIALKVFKVLECAGLARVDFFVTKDDRIYVNEINTIPGFTNLSMYPRLWLYGGMPYKEMVSLLIESAFLKDKLFLAE